MPIPDEFSSTIKCDWSWISAPEYKVNLSDNVSDLERAHVSALLRRSLRFVARISYVVSCDIKKYTFLRSGIFEEEICPGRLVRYIASLMAFLWMLLFRRWGTDYVFPPFLALIVFQLTTSSAWDFSNLYIAV